MEDFKERGLRYSKRCCSTLLAGIEITQQIFGTKVLEPISAVIENVQLLKFLSSCQNTCNLKIKKSLFIVFKETKPSRLHMFIAKP